MGSSRRSAFLDAIERGEHPGGETAEVWRRLGEAEFQAGRNLDALRAAWRTGTRAAWRGAADLAAEAGMPTPTVIALAEAIFVFTDELATDVVEGYLRRQSDEAGERERRRRRLMSLLLDPDGRDPEALAHAAELARWPLPRAVAVLALDRRHARTARRAGSISTPSSAATRWRVARAPRPGRARPRGRARGAQSAATPRLPRADGRRP